jgi:hypothetical protein
MKFSSLITIVAALALTSPACSRPTAESPDSDSYGKTITPD